MYKIRVARGWSISPDTTEVVVAKCYGAASEHTLGRGICLPGPRPTRRIPRSSMIGQSEEAASLARETSPPGRSQRTRHKRAYGRCPRPPRARLRSHRRTRAQGRTPGFRPRHVLVQVEGGLGLWLFWPVAAGPSSSASPSPEPGVECRFATAIRVRLAYVASEQDHVVRGSVDMQHGHGRCALAA